MLTKLESNEAIGLIFIIVRATEGLGQIEMARRLFTTQGHLSKVERGQQLPSAEMCLRLISEFKINPGAFFIEVANEK